MKGVSNATTVVAAVVVIAILGGAFYLFTQQPAHPPQSSTTVSSTTSSSTTPSSPPPGVIEAFNQHLSKLDARDIPAVLTDFQSDGSVVWTGKAAGLGGVYNGTGNIRLLYSAALSTATQITITPAHVQRFNNSATQVTVNSTLGVTGSSNILGKLNGTIAASTVYSYTGGAWKIVKESWDFKVFNVAFSGGSTTFPEWQKVGPINPNHKSTDWLHNFAWDYGGPGGAVIVSAYVVFIGVIFVVKRVWRPSK